MVEWKVTLSDTTIGEEEVRAVSAVLRSGWLTQGACVEEFEREFAKTIGVKHCVAVANGTAALHVAYKAVGLREGDEYIIPALTFVATLNAGIYCGAIPVLADCKSTDDLTICPDDVESKITPRTRLIVAMPYGGFCPDMVALHALASRYGIELVEDAAHAPLAEINGQKIGTFGRASAFSFFSNKNMATGEGGMVATNDDDVAEHARRMRSHGMTTLTWDRHRGHAADYDVIESGYNYRLDEVHGAIGIEQLKKLNESNRSRVGAAREMRDRLSAIKIDGLDIPFANQRGVSVHHLFVILLPRNVDRATFRKGMADAGIQTSVHYPLLHKFSAVRDLFGDNSDGHLRLPNVESIGERLVSLPMGPHLNSAAINLIVESVRTCLSYD
jgi:dTDP-4-amino-4,6-dideoxygalactose transaminase